MCNSEPELAGAGGGNARQRIRQIPCAQPRLNLTLHPTSAQRAQRDGPGEPAFVNEQIQLGAAETDKRQDLATTQQADPDLGRHVLDTKRPYRQRRAEAERRDGGAGLNTAGYPRVHHVLVHATDATGMAVVHGEPAIALKTMNVRDRQGRAQIDVAWTHNAHVTRMGERKVRICAPGGLTNGFHDELLQQ